MVRTAVGFATKVLPMGPLAAAEERRKPMVTPSPPGAPYACDLLALVNFSVPSWSQPVMGRIGSISWASVPDSFLSLDSSSQSPS